MKHLNLTPELYQYIMDVSVRENEVMRKLREETARLPLAVMQINPNQAQLMQLLLRLIQAENVLELGTFTGYSALAMAYALPENGKVITCDINEEWTSKALPFWREAGLEHKIELRIGEALDSLQALLDEGLGHTFDFIFIDADKTNYLNYYEMALKLIAPKGLIAIDNVLWSGKVIDEQETGGQTRKIRELNERIKQDDRVFPCLLPISDGLFLVQPK